MEGLTVERLAGRREQRTLWSELSFVAPPWGLAAALAAAWLAVAPATGDLAAQDYRADLGLTLWDNGWYGGHHMPGYSVLYPPLASLLGARVVGALSAVAAAVVFERLVRDAPGARIAAPWFAAATATTLITGRLTFALGLALGLAALLAAARGRQWSAVALAAATSLGSPVAGAFVALAAAAWWLDACGGRLVPRRRRPPPRERSSAADGERRAGAPRAWASVALGVGAVAPALCLALAFPEGGSFPFEPSGFWPPLVLLGAAAFVVRREARVLRIGLALYLVALVASFALETPMGGNASRLGAILAGPVLAALLWPRDRRALALLALPLVYWQWVAPVDNVARVLGDASRHERYHAGLLDFLRTREGAPFRIEIPFTENHWEARWVAPHVPLARGWERQLDVERNALFYDDGPPTPASYRRWLDENAVRYVALADAPLDYSAEDEARLVRRGLPYLREVWRDAHWRVYKVTRARPLARGAAHATGIDDDELRLRATRGGTVDLRVRFTPYWRLTRGAGCVREAPGGWTELRVDRPGPLVLRTRFAFGRVRATSARCSDDRRSSSPPAS